MSTWYYYYVIDNNSEYILAMASDHRPTMREAKAWLRQRASIEGWQIEYIDTFYEVKYSELDWPPYCELDIL